MIDIESDDDFSRAVLDVKPLNIEPRVRLRTKRIDKKILLARRQTAVEEHVSENNKLSDSFVDSLDANAILSFQRSGLQHTVFKKFRLGKYQIDARLDLHFHSVLEARKALSVFIVDCVANNVRCGLITHGKGEGREQPARLKSCVAHWLPQLDDVLAFHSAQKTHGGGGSTYILIRKSGVNSLDI